MDISEVKAQLDRAGFNNLRLGVNKEIKALSKILDDNETIQYATSGVLEGTVLMVLTQRRVLFIDCGLLYGMKQTEIPLDMVNSVSFKKGLLMGTITISHGSGNSLIKNVPSNNCSIMTDKIKKCAEEYKGRKINTKTNVNSSVADELLKLKSLVESGILTQEEFETQKAKLLVK
ncbi:TPA: PH domain-containing protein [Streptococcus pyogenes]|uniref:PH domain-containing protein n=1 Tax=Streptococcus intermedius TaxID=1338 RepID=UPI00066089D2|nr:PH domain-containing protein [Streptococcus intermedius]HEP2720990.1 PH domain-containing protein [Streptococcus pyogenes]HEP3486146.1 PH domain-containing protein [Streptococcus pyogenes]HEP4439524.1 PH domain-containing protein [Streptococcus pyogenes]HEP4864769.1 PH domain-containing protein [Streptococcus pyogenes]